MPWPARHRIKSVAELPGGIRRTRVTVLYMLATGDIEVDVAEAGERAATGVTHMKIKVGGKPVEKDIERTNAIRKAVRLTGIPVPREL